MNWKWIFFLLWPALRCKTSVTGVHRHGPRHIERLHRESDCTASSRPEPQKTENFHDWDSMSLESPMKYENFHNGPCKAKVPESSWLATCFNSGTLPCIAIFHLWLFVESRKIPHHNALHTIEGTFFLRCPGEKVAKIEPLEWFFKKSFPDGKIKESFLDSRSDGDVILTPLVNRCDSSSRTAYPTEIEGLKWMWEGQPGKHKEKKIYQRFFAKIFHVEENSPWTGPFQGEPKKV